VVMFQVEFFWVVTLCSLVLHAEDGGIMDLRNAGILPQHYTASQPRRPRLDTRRLFGNGLSTESVCVCE